MIVNFSNQGTEDVFDGDNTKAARKVCPQSLWRIARRKLDQLDSATRLEDLRVPPGNQLERLHGDRDDQYSIRINDQFRLCFAWSPTGPANVEIVDCH